MPRNFQSEASDIAFRRIDSVLRAHGLSHSAIRARHCQRILSNALTQAGTDNETSVETRASQLLFNELDRGLEALARAIEPAPEPLDRHRLLIAINRAGIAQKYPDALLGQGQLPAEEAAELRELYQTQHIPELKRRSMGAPTLRFETLDEVTSTTTALFGKWPLSAKLIPLLWALLLFLLVYLFAK